MLMWKIDNGHSPLLVALQRGNRGITNILVAAPGIDVNILGNCNHTPMNLAREYNDDLEEILIVADPEFSPSGFTFYYLPEQLRECLQCCSEY